MLTAQEDELGLSKLEICLRQSLEQVQASRRLESSRSLTQSAATKDLSIELQHWKTSSEQYEQRWRNALNQILAIGGDAGSGGGCGIVGASSKAATSPLSPGAANPCPRAPESSSSMMASLAEKHGREISKMQSEMEILFNAKIDLEEQVENLTKSKEKYKARFNEQMKWIKDVCDKFDAKHDMWQKAFERISDKSMTEDEVQWLQADHQKMLDLLKNIVLQQANQSAAASGSGGKKRKSGSRSSDILLEGPTTANGSKVSSNASRTVINEVQSATPSTAKKVKSSSSKKSTSTSALVASLSTTTTPHHCMKPTSYTRLSSGLITKQSSSLSRTKSPKHASSPKIAAPSSTTTIASSSVALAKPKQQIQIRLSSRTKQNDLLADILSSDNLATGAEVRGEGGVGGVVVEEKSNKSRLSSSSASSTDSSIPNHKLQKSFSLHHNHGSPMVDIKTKISVPFSSNTTSVSSSHVSAKTLAADKNMDDIVDFDENDYQEAKFDHSMISDERKVPYHDHQPDIAGLNQVLAAARTTNSRQDPSSSTPTRSKTSNTTLVPSTIESKMKQALRLGKTQNSPSDTIVIESSQFPNLERISSEILSSSMRKKAASDIHHQRKQLARTASPLGPVNIALPKSRTRPNSRNNLTRLSSSLAESTASDSLQISFGEGDGDVAIGVSVDGGEGENFHEYVEDDDDTIDMSNLIPSSGNGASSTWRQQTKKNMKKRQKMRSADLTPSCQNLGVDNYNHGFDYQALSPSPVKPQQEKDDHQKHELQLPPLSGVATTATTTPDGAASVRAPSSSSTTRDAAVSTTTMTKNPGRIDWEERVLKEARPEEPNFKYKQVVRVREDRKRLHAEGCDCCNDYYELNKDLKPVLELGAGEVTDRRQVTGKHRTTAISADTPIGFWDIGMPDTEEISKIIQQNKR